MSQPTNAEIMQAIAALGERMERRLSVLEAKVESNTLAVVEMRGELRGLSSWLSSMDQRFVAIMRPYEPPADRGRT